MEVFLFVSPLGKRCLSNELNFIEAKKELGLSCDNCAAHIIPFTSFQNITEVLIRQEHNANDIATRNKLTEQSYQVMNDYQAVSLIGGNKKARQFLVKIQSMINHDHREYSPELVNEILVDLKLNLSDFEAASNDPFVKDAVKHDIELAMDMGITQTPSTVIYDEKNVGVLVEGCLTTDQYLNLMTHTMSDFEQIVPDHHANKLKVL